MNISKSNLVIFDLDDTLFDTTGQLSGSLANVDKITSFPGVVDLIKKIKAPRILVSKGDVVVQNKKIDILGLRSYFDAIIICPTDEEKLSVFENSLKKFNITNPESVLVVGNRIDSEIRYGNMLGCTTVYIQQGHWDSLEPKDALEHADLTLEKTTDLAQYFGV